MRRLRNGAPAVLAALTVAGCGGAAGETQAIVQSGGAIYARSCAGCHSLTGRESGTDGGDLLHTRLSVADLASFAEAMPTRPRLSPASARAVAEFVHARGRMGHAPGR